jgi:hypothetical protein
MPMNDPVIRRELIAEQAEQAALSAAAGRTPTNPYPPDTDAALEWQATFERFTTQHSSPESEASA